MVMHVRRTAVCSCTVMHVRRTAVQCVRMLTTVGGTVWHKQNGVVGKDQGAGGSVGERSKEQG